MRDFSYATPTSIDEAVRLGSAADTRFLAGGTTMVDLMKLGVERPDNVVDLMKVEGLSGFDLSGEELVFGALVPMSAVADDPRVRRDYPVLAESLWLAASQQLRNMATLGGNLLQRTRCAFYRDVQYPCNRRVPGSGCPAQERSNRGHAILGGSPHCIATYPGDWAAALIALDAAIDVAGPRGGRTIAFGDLHLRPGATPEVETTLEPGEIVLRTRIPATPAGRASTYLKVRDRQSYAFAIASAAVALEMEGDLVKDVRIGIGGLATVPWRARDAEAGLRGRRLTEGAAVEVGLTALAEAETRPENAFRKVLGANTVTEALLVAKKRARG